MPRQRPETRARVRRNIEDAALSILADKGYDATGMRDVAAAAGMSPASLYNHYQGKEELFTALVERYQGRVLDEDEDNPLRDYMKACDFPWDIPKLAEALDETELAFGVLLRESANTVLNDDDRAVDDEAEVERTETHEVRADAALNHARDRHEHRNWNNSGSQDCRAQVPHQEEQHDDDEQRAFGQIRADRNERLIDELRTVVDGSCRDAFGQ